MVRYGFLAVLTLAALLPVQASAGGGPATVRVSVSSSGVQANGSSLTGGPHRIPSGGTFISADGRFVAFSSVATNLSARRDTNSAQDVFVRDLSALTTRRASLSTRGAQENAASTVAGISRHGRFVLFMSRASNLSRYDSNHQPDVFVRDRSRNRTALVSISHGSRLPGQNFALSMSSNGRFIAFMNYDRSRGLPEQVYLRDRRLHRTVRIGGGNDFCPAAVVSDNGRYVAYACGEHDPLLAGTVLLDRRTGRQKLLRGRSGANATIATAMSPDGRYTVFTWIGLDAEGTGTWNDVYEYDRVTGTYTLVTTQPPFTEHPWSGGVSDDGRYVGFSSDSPTLVAGDTNGVADVFRRDLVAHITERVSLTSTGAQAVMASTGGAISGDGSMIVFESRDGTLVGGDTNHRTDAFVRGPIP